MAAIDHIDPKLTMRIQRVSWSNFRRLPDGSFTAKRHVVMIGPNDTGKSSVMHALNLCLGMTYSQVAMAITPRDFTDPTLPLQIKIVLDDVQPDDRAAFPDEITAGPPEVLEINLEATLDSADHDQKTVRRFFPDSGHNRAPTREQLRVIGFVYVPAVRSLYRELGGSEGTVQSLLSNLDIGESLPLLKASIDSYRSVLAESEVVSGFRADLADALTRSLPSPVTTDDVDVLSEADLLDDPLSGLTVTVRDGEHKVPLAEQSDGVRALSLISLMGMAHKSAKIVAFDEPETHLHPIAQRAVSYALSTATTQRILVTHSPSVVSKMAPLDIVSFGPDRRCRQLPSTAPITNFETTARHWSYRLIEPLTARQIVLVEGPCDRLVLERIAALDCFDLDRAGVAIFELGGKTEFPSAYRLFGPTGFDLRVCGLTDEDARDAWAGELGCSATELESKGFMVCNPDLEGLYVGALGVPRVTEIFCSWSSIGERQLLRSCGVSSCAELDAEKLAKFSRSRKVPAALAVCSALDSGDIGLFAPVAAILQQLR